MSKLLPGWPKAFDHDLFLAFGMNASKYEQRLLEAMSYAKRVGGNKNNTRQRCLYAIAAVKAQQKITDVLGLLPGTSLDSLHLPPSSFADCLSVLGYEFKRTEIDDYAELLGAKIPADFAWRVAVMNGKDYNKLANLCQALANRRKMEQEQRLIAERRDQARRDAQSLVGPDGKVTLEDICSFLGVVELVDVSSHPDCGLVTTKLSLKQAAQAIIKHREAGTSAWLGQFFPPPQGQVSDYFLAQRLGLSVKAAKLLRPLDHAGFDALVASWSDDRRAELEKKAAEIEEQRFVERHPQWAAAKAELGIAVKHDDLTTTDAAKALGISTTQVRDAIAKGYLPGHQVMAKWHYGKQPFWRVPLSAVLEAHRNQPEWLQAIHQRKQRKESKEQERQDNTLVRLPLRPRQPSKMAVYLGPTNSGKTYRALEHLAERRSGTYAAPLRMLALEAYERLSALVGEDAVGLVTGEERINETAPIICCTAEMAPMKGDLLVLDEVQWAADQDRGWAWTRLLAGAEVDELYVTGEVGAAPLVKAVLGADVEIVYCERLCPLRLGKPLKLTDVPGRSVVVAFSRKAVLHLAGLLSNSGRKSGVLYGALPPEVRREQVRRFVDGDLEVLVATDVIGHGVNLPVDTVVFAETNKFDGQVRRQLALWEVAQIGGRAGRFGMSDAGTVSTLAGVPGFTPEHGLVYQVINRKAAIDLDGRPAYRRVDKGQVAPGLSDLAVTKATELIAALTAWQKAAKLRLASTPWADVADMEPLVSRLNLLRQNGLLSELSLDDAWALARSPLDPDDERWPDAGVLVALARALVGQGTMLGVLRRLSLSGTSDNLERSARALVALRWATLAFPGRLGITHGEVSQALDKVTDELNKALGRAIKDGVAHCESCGAVCAPWFSECDRCHFAYRRSYGYWGYDEDDDDDEEDDEDEDEEDYDDDDDEDERTVLQRQSWDHLISDKVRSLGPEVGRPLGCSREWWATVGIPLLEEVSGDERAARRKILESWEQNGWRGDISSARKKLAPFVGTAA